MDQINLSNRKQNISSHASLNKNKKYKCGSDIRLSKLLNNKIAKTKKDYQHQILLHPIQGDTQSKTPLHTVDASERIKSNIGFYQLVQQTAK